MFGFHANATTKYNRSLLKGHNVFRNLKVQYENRIEEYHKSPNKKEVDPIVLARVRGEIKEWAKRERRKRSLYVFSALILLLGLIGAMFYSNFRTTQQLEINNSELLAKQHVANNYKKAVFYLNDAEEWLAKGHFKNALFQYNKVLELDKANHTANLGLVIAQANLCVTENQYCNELESSVATSLNNLDDQEQFNTELQKFSFSANKEVQAVLGPILSGTDF